MNVKRWIPGRVKRTLGRIISNPIVGRVVARLYNDQIPSRGCIVDTSSSRISPQTKASLFWQIYEGAEIRFIQEYLDPGRDVIELGGGLGVVSCQIRKILDPGRKLVVVEADPELANHIRHTLGRNYPDQPHTVVNKVIDTRSSHDVSAFRKGETVTTGKLHEDGNTEGIEVERTTLGQVAEDYVEEYSLVSDIEGEEWGILLHDVASLERCRQIVIELHRASRSKETAGIPELIQRIRKAGFRLEDRYGPVCAFRRT